MRCPDTVELTWTSTVFDPGWNVCTWTCCTENPGRSVVIRMPMLTFSLSSFCTVKGITPLLPERVRSDLGTSRTASTIVSTRACTACVNAVWPAVLPRHEVDTVRSEAGPNG